MRKWRGRTKRIPPAEGVVVVEKTGEAMTCVLLASFFVGFFFAMRSKSSSSSMDRKDKSSFGLQRKLERRARGERESPLIVFKWRRRREERKNKTK